MSVDFVTTTQKKYGKNHRTDIIAVHFLFFPIPILHTCFRSATSSDEVKWIKNGLCHWIVRLSARNANRCKRKQNETRVNAVYSFYSRQIIVIDGKIKRKTRSNATRNRGIRKRRGTKDRRLKKSKFWRQSDWTWMNVVSSLSFGYHFDRRISFVRFNWWNGNHRVIFSWFGRTKCAHTWRLSQ